MSREQIVATALDLIDRAGLASFSLRDVAQALGVYHRALYWHFPAGRTELLAAVASLAFEDVQPRGLAPTDWQAWLRALFVRYRQSLRAHPHVAALFGAQIVSNAGVDPALVENALQALQAAGFRGPRLHAAYNTVIAALLGYVTLELAPAPADDSHWAARFEAQLRDLPADRFPMIVANREAMINRSFILRWDGGAQVPLDDGFAMYVDTVIAGLDAMARAEPPEAGPAQ